MEEDEPEASQSLLHLPDSPNKPLTVHDLDSDDDSVADKNYKPTKAEEREDSEGLYPFSIYELHSASSASLQ